MPSNFSENGAARSNSRARVFHEANVAYLSYLKGLKVNFHDMTEEDYARARADARLDAAHATFTEAIELSRAAGKPVEEAVARHQLGLVCQLRGDHAMVETLMRAALETLGTLPGDNRVAEAMSCHFHLGVAALKRGETHPAAIELRRSRHLAESRRDFPTMRTCDQALAQCPDADEEVSTVPSLPLASRESAPRPEPARVPAPSTPPPLRQAVPVGPTRSSTRDTVMLASFSEEANEDLKAHLDEVGTGFGRPVTVARVAFGATDPNLRTPKRPSKGEHVCAVVLVLEKEGLGNHEFRKFAESCMDRVLTVPDFRLFVYPSDHSMTQLREMADRDPLVSTLFDTTQVTELPTVEDLTSSLVGYVRNLERTRQIARWRRLRLRLARPIGWASSMVIGVTALFALLGFAAWGMDVEPTWLGPDGPALAALALGILAFPLQAPLMFVILRGGDLSALPGRDRAVLMRWVGIGMIILIGAASLQNELEGPVRWIFVGVGAGVILDVARRVGRRARRAMIDLAPLAREAAASPSGALLVTESLKPFSCPLLPSMAARVFLSYTRSSERSSRLAAELHTGLKAEGARPFLDRADIALGADWRRTLNRRIADCDAFVCIVDEKGLNRPWVAAELMAALEGHRITGNPHIMILLDPAAKSASGPMLPLFREVVAAEPEPARPGRPQVIETGDGTVGSLVWGLAPGRFAPTAVLTSGPARLVMVVLSLLGLLGGLGIPGGIVSGIMAVLEKTNRFAYSTMLADRGLLIPVALLCAFWIGFGLRMSIAARNEIDSGPPMPEKAALLAAMGASFTLAVFIPLLTPYVTAWAVLVAAAGWLMVSPVLAFSDRVSMSE